MTEGDRDQFFQEQAKEASRVYSEIYDAISRSELPSTMLVGILEDLQQELWHDLHSEDLDVTDEPEIELG